MRTKNENPAGAAPKRLLPGGGLALAALLGFSACQQPLLTERTVRMASSLTDLQYQLVLENIAMLAYEPDRLPWHVKLDKGTVQIEDEGRFSIDLSPLASDLAPATGSFGERRQTLQWGLVPVTDPEELRDLHALYRTALGAEVEAEVLDEFKDVPTGWFRSGKRNEVPENHAAVGYWRDQAAWVLREDLADLTHFTLEVLTIVELKADERDFNRQILPGSRE